MALRFVDSFDHYATADILQKWTLSGGTAPTIVAAAGRRSTACLRITGSSGASLTKTLDSQATWIIGFALNVSQGPSGAARLLVCYDTGTEHLRLRLNTDGTISVMRGGSTVLSTSAATIAFASYGFLEFKFTINDTTGSYEVRYNGAMITSGSGVDTRNGANSTVNQFQLRSDAVGESPGGTYSFDDLYICDGSGSSNNDFLGDVRVDCYLPDGNGNSSQLVGSDGNSVDNYALIDEASQNGDTDYVQSATVSNKDTYTFSNMSHTPADIFGVQVNMIAKKDDSGTRSVCAVTRSGGSDTDGTTQALSTAYLCYREIRETDPNTAAAWTTTNLNNAEFGIKVAA
jgi:hypothetical protein